MVCVNQSIQVIQELFSENYIGVDKVVVVVVGYYGGWKTGQECVVDYSLPLS